MIRMGKQGVILALALMCGATASFAQEGRDEGLKRAVERRFDVLPLRDGLALHPKVPIAGVRSIEVTGGTIAIDGQPTTGAELRTKLGAEADQVLQLSYLSDARPAGALRRHSSRSRTARPTVRPRCSRNCPPTDVGRSAAAAPSEASTA